jgi:hypothetical protein
MNRASFDLLDDFGATTVSVLRDSNYPSCDDETIFAADTATNVIVFSVHDLNVSSPTYDEDLLNILIDLKLNGVETIYGCSYTILCLRVNLFFLLSSLSLSLTLTLLLTFSASIPCSVNRLQSFGDSPQQLLV